jgi:hypothetical protein
VLDESVDGREDVLVARHIVEGAWAIFFDPRIINIMTCWAIRARTLPWQIVFSLDGQVCDYAFLLPSEVA